MKQKNDELQKLLGRSQTLSNMLLIQMNLLCKLGIGGDVCNIFKKSNVFVKASTPLASVGDDYIGPFYPYYIAFIFLLLSKIKPW